MSPLTVFVQRIVDWLFDRLATLEAHDRDSYVEAAINAREASQRIHRLEQPSSALQP